MRIIAPLIAFLLLNFANLPISVSKTHHFSREIVYLGAGTLFGTSAQFAKLGSKVCELFSTASTIGKECCLLSQLCSSATRHIFAEMRKKSSDLTASESSWRLNRERLSSIPAGSIQDVQLIHFLQERWLAKLAGISSTAVQWVYPCFGINVQVHPLTNHAYARLLSTGLSLAYIHRREAWKQTLPHPHYFPLILTRPGNLQEYLPSHIGSDDIEIVDVTDLAPFPLDRVFDPARTLCIQRLQQEGIGGIRILQLPGQSLALLEQHHEFLLDWVSCFGLAANRIELDRWPIAQKQLPQERLLEEKSFSIDEFMTTLDACEQKWQTSPPFKAIMLQGTVQVLKGLFAHCNASGWSPTRLAIAKLSMSKITMQLEQLMQKEEDASFFEIASHLEQIHADLSSLLEIFNPFIADHFHPIYLNLLPIPSRLKPLTSCGIHSSAMTSLAGIFHAAKKNLGRAPHVLYGENTYFECVGAAKKMTSATPVTEATEADWEQADILLAQFNPVLKLGIHNGYRVEKIAEMLHQCLHAKKDITLALDCTIDFIDSARLFQLLHEFQQEIEDGKLNVIGYRSGNKFDLFGMDNYSGAPFFMIHNQDPKWAAFNSLLIDPILQTDALSFNWFCLSYQYAAPQLDHYRSQIFENTRALLNKIPERLLTKTDVRYRVSPCDKAADAAFIDIQVAGPLHAMKAAALVAAKLCLDSMEKGHPIFNRPSLGFYHPNFTMLFGQENSTLRLTLGLDPAEVELFAHSLQAIDSLN